MNILHAREQDMLEGQEDMLKGHESEEDMLKGQE